MVYAYGIHIQLKFVRENMPLCNTVWECWLKFYRDSHVASPSHRTLLRWWEHWEKFGSVPAEYERHRRALCRRFRRFHKYTNVPDDAVRKLRDILTTSPELYLDEMQEALYLYGGPMWMFSLKAIWTTLRHRLGWSLKKFAQLSRSRDLSLRLSFKARMYCYHDPKMFVFVDETNRELGDERRRRGWGPRGQDNSLDEFFPKRGRRFTMLGACDVQGMVLPACELVEGKRGDEDADPSRGTIDKDRFLAWLRQRLCPTLGNASRSEPRSVVVMDNATIHHDPEGQIRESIEAMGASLVYTSPYSPDLNPIEYCFHQYKAYLRRHFGAFGGIRNFFALHLNALQCISHRDMCKYYKHVGYIRNVPSIPSVEEQEEVIVYVASVVASHVSMSRCRKRRRESQSEEYN